MSELIHHLCRALQDATDRTDGQLLEGFVARRDEAALEAIIRRHGAMVWGVCCRTLHNPHDAEDAFQATFLVLVRKAASVIPREQVANWLYGVAYRTALRARAAAARRRARERQVETLPEPEAMRQDDLLSDLRPVLDQELSRLPDKYRAPVVLCDLEGKTHQEAARQLGWPVGTVSGRLVRARALLAKRLTRHGLAPSAGAVAGALAQESALACVPGTVLSSTIKAATLVAAGQAAAGVVPAHVAALTKEVVTSMLLNKLAKATAVVLVAVALAGGTGLMMLRANGPEPQEKKAEVPAPAPGEVVKGAVNADELAEVYRTNEALADERFTAKQTKVTGVLQGISRQGLLPTKEGDKVVYQLYLYAGDGKRAPHVGATFRESHALLSFRFTQDDRPQLAKLKQGQLVTVEGRPQAEADNQGRVSIYFFDCKIVKVEQ